MPHNYWMQLALAQAQLAADGGDVPVGAVVVRQDQRIALGHNRREQDQDPTGHAEIITLRAAARQLGQWRLTDCTLYVTLEPCAMCAGAIVQARLGLLVYGADDPKAGAIRTVWNLPASPLSCHPLTVLAGVEELACRKQLQQWFRRLRP
nr:tRNA adenosine(34) deaminase TadA [Candidatus Cyanaurora vandensis]